MRFHFTVYTHTSLTTNHTATAAPQQHCLSDRLYFEPTLNHAKLCLNEKKPDFDGATHKGFAIGQRPHHYLDNFTDQYHKEYYAEGTENHEIVLQTISNKSDRTRRREKEDYYQTPNPTGNRESIPICIPVEKPQVRSEAPSNAPNKVLPHQGSSINQINS
mgnify:FL=1